MPFQIKFYCNKDKKPYTVEKVEFSVDPIPEEFANLTDRAKGLLIREVDDLFPTGWEIVFGNLESDGEFEIFTYSTRGDYKKEQRKSDIERLASNDG